MVVERMHVAALLALGIAVAPSAALAEEPAAAPSKEPASTPSGTPSGTPAKVSPMSAARVLDRIIDRPHTIAEIEAGIIALPGAPISPGQRGGDTPFGTIGRGDATIQTGIHVLYRFTRDLEIGAGALFAPSPTSDKEYGGLRGLQRTHSRSYFFLGVEGRYIPIHYDYFEAWVGVSVGGVVVADRFVTEGDSVPTILGTREVTIRTEGLGVGAQLGGSYYISENWIAGLNFRGYTWVLPDAARCSSIGDCATLSGTVLALETGLTIGYRLSL